MIFDWNVEAFFFYQSHEIDNYAINTPNYVFNFGNRIEEIKQYLWKTWIFLKERWKILTCIVLNGENDKCSLSNNRAALGKSFKIY